MRQKIIPCQFQNFSKTIKAMIPIYSFVTKVPLMRERSKKIILEESCILEVHVIKAENDIFVYFGVVLLSFLLDKNF